MLSLNNSLLVHFLQRWKICFQILLPNQACKVGENLNLFTGMWYKKRNNNFSLFFPEKGNQKLGLITQIHIAERHFLLTASATLLFNSLFFFFIGLSYRPAWVTFYSLSVCYGFYSQDRGSFHVQDIPKSGLTSSLENKYLPISITKANPTWKFKFQLLHVPSV